MVNHAVAKAVGSGIDFAWQSAGQRALNRKELQMKIQRFLFALATSVFAASAAVPVVAGPIIIAGTDADDHGFASGGVNETGWFFMQRAFENLAPAVSNGNKVAVCIGCNGSQAQSAFDSAVALSSLVGSGWSTANLTSLADISGFFDGTGSRNTGNSGILYMPTVSSNVGGGINDSQLGIVNGFGSVINNFIIAGGGLFTQEQANSGIGYGWLTSLLPGISVNGDNNGSPFNASSLTLTPAGTAAFPGLTDSIISAATPWHAYFTGNFGSLTTLVTGPIANNAPGSVVLGGGAGGAIICGTPGAPACPVDPTVPEPSSWVMLIAGFGLVGTMMRRRHIATVAA